jgi:hypothetical protein
MKELDHAKFFCQVYNPEMYKLQFLGIGDSALQKCTPHALFAPFWCHGSAERDPKLPSARARQPGRISARQTVARRELMKLLLSSSRRDRKWESCTLVPSGLRCDAYPPSAEWVWHKS